MKLLTLATSALLATHVSSRSTFFGSSDAAPLDANLAIPGENPLEHCADPKDDILALKKVDLNPNPPRAGTELTITASGILSEDVGEGAKIQLQVKYGLITIINQSADLCETVKNVDLECPLKKGKMGLTKVVKLPAQIPPGNYHVSADVVSKDGDKVTCLKASVEFKRGGAVVYKQGL
ncbi:phosphatidylinositol/phosphatidylglycerol transfer protein [Zymoseptoria brevis]|uniref:Phosphatidylglycerol/phosphatidylinositol transfer protein n=1 Tax=Zymoseptoria brevis TaxID=1047168 RepID=A0A0F4GGM3_9PEZI|nr:phosphatidylinositol/phosphatidylglycerol transfer protein [Zymoseptoria brevis]